LCRRPRRPPCQIRLEINKDYKATLKRRLPTTTNPQTLPTPLFRKFNNRDCLPLPNSSTDNSALEPAASMGERAPPESDIAQLSTSVRHQLIYHRAPPSNLYPKTKTKKPLTSFRTWALHDMEIQWPAESVSRTSGFRRVAVQRTLLLVKLRCDSLAQSRGRFDCTQKGLYHLPSTISGHGARIMMSSWWPEASWRTQQQKQQQQQQYQTNNTPQSSPKGLGTYSHCACVRVLTPPRDTLCDNSNSSSS